MTDNFTYLSGTPYKEGSRAGMPGGLFILWEDPSRESLKVYNLPGKHPPRGMFLQNKGITGIVVINN